MGFFTRLLGRETEQPRQADNRTDDEIAVERYEYLLRTAPPETIERAHVEAFEKLTPAQLDLLFDRFSESALSADERPADARPATLAKVATRAEVKQPGTLTRTLGPDYGGQNVGALVGYSVLDTVAGYVITSALVSAFFPYDFGFGIGRYDSVGDASGDSDATDRFPTDDGSNYVANDGDFGF